MFVFKQLFAILKCVVPLGLNEVGTFKSSSKVIYWHPQQGIYTQTGKRDASIWKW